jgi:multicomponent Na+:H+ antiporter subunit F
MSIILTLSIILIVLTYFILLYRCVSGEHILDRVLAFDLIGVTSIGLFIVLYIIKENSLFLDLAVVLTIISFITALVFSTFLPQQKDKE